MTTKPLAVVTGASAGIGAATARRLASDGFHVVLGARREDRIRRLAADIGGEARRLDVTDPGSVAAFCRGTEPIRVLVNNAGGALGIDPIERADDTRWVTMYETNVLGTLRMIRATLPRLEASGDGLVVNIGSIAGFETYVGGGGYTAAKHAVRALTETLRLELLGRPVRVTEIAPGLVETEFSLVRFEGDAKRAAGVYEGMKPLRSEDIADCVGWVAALPSHVNIDQMVVRPRDQATATAIARRTNDSERKT